jgi:hypothetical protein
MSKDIREIPEVKVRPGELSREEAVQFFSDFYFGEHHFPSELKVCGHGWMINHYMSMSTFDYNHLTRLVLMAHDRCIRVEIAPCNAQYIRIKVHKRDREGEYTERHPTIQQAIKSITENPRDKALCLALDSDSKQ